jgi:glucosamine--fructose-6-phosphate aminotransferase (isomerizing)
MTEEIKKTLDEVHEPVKKIAEKYKDYEHGIYLGRDTAYPTAMEGALKLKEVSYVDANAYAFGELKHGPLALVDDRFFEISLVPDDSLYDKVISNLQEVLARGGHVIAITNADKFSLQVENVVAISSNIKLFSPLLMNLAMQLFAYYMTIAKGNNVDQPRNLAKSVTVE